MLEMFSRLERAITNLARSRTEQVNVSISLQDALGSAGDTATKARVLRQITGAGMGGRATGSIRAGLSAYAESLTEIGKLREQRRKTAIRLGQLRMQMAWAKSANIPKSSQTYQMILKRRIALEKKHAASVRPIIRQRTAGARAIRGAAAAASGVVARGGGMAAAARGLSRAVGAAGVAVSAFNEAVSKGKDIVSQYWRYSPGGIGAMITETVGQFRRNIFISREVQKEMLEFSQAEKRLKDNLAPVEAAVSRWFLKIGSWAQGVGSDVLEKIFGRSPLAGGTEGDARAAERLSKIQSEISTQEVLLRSGEELLEQRKEERKREALRRELFVAPQDNDIIQSIDERLKMMDEDIIRTEKLVNKDRENLKKLTESKKGARNPDDMREMMAGWALSHWKNQNLPQFGLNPDQAAIDMARRFGLPGKPWPTLREAQDQAAKLGVVPGAQGPGMAGAPPRLLTDAEKRDIGNRLNDRWNQIRHARQIGREQLRARAAARGNRRPDQHENMINMAAAQADAMMGKQMRDLERKINALGNLRPGTPIPNWLNPLLPPPRPAQPGVP